MANADLDTGFDSLPLLCCDGKVSKTFPDGRKPENILESRTFTSEEGQQRGDEDVNISSLVDPDKKDLLLFSLSSSDECSLLSSNDNTIDATSTTSAPYSHVIPTSKSLAPPSQPQDTVPFELEATRSESEGNSKSDNNSELLALVHETTKEESDHFHSTQTLNHDHELFQVGTTCDKLLLATTSDTKALPREVSHTTATGTSSGSMTRTSLVSSMFLAQLQDDLSTSTNTSQVITGRPPTRLYLSADHGYFSSYQLTVRQNVEFFEALPHDVETPAQGRPRPIVLGQVGIRCAYCAPLSLRAPGAVCYPSKRSGVYQAVQNIAKIHWIEHCTAIPRSVRQELCRKRSMKYPMRRRASKAKWATRATALGVYEDNAYGILRFAPTIDALGFPREDEEEEKEDKNSSHGAMLGDDEMCVQSMKNEHADETIRQT